MPLTIHRPRRYRPRLEALEERCQPTTFTVVLTTDAGGAGGQMVSATTGDLRYCISQADATHTATRDTIVFSRKVFGTPQTITLDSTLGPLVVNDAHRLTITAADLGRVTVSGGDATEVFDVAGGTVALRNLVISHGAATGADSVGGGINNAGNLTLTDCILDHDTAIFGGGLFNNGNVTLTGCILDHDSAGLGGGLYNNGTATLTGCTLSNDSAQGTGGGVWNDGTVTLTGCTLSNDSAGGGGGIFSLTTLTLTGCTLSNDSAPTGGGGIEISGTATLTGCTLSNDLATGSGGGGGIDNGGTLTLTNCTLSNDSVSGAGLFGGGGLFNNGGTATLTNCTLSNNSASTFGGGIEVRIGLGGTVNLTNTIVAGNSAPTAPDISGPVGTADHNLIGDGTGSGISNGVNGNQVGGNGNPVIDPRLGPLANNGGPTQTLALLPGSPALRNADNAAAPHTDQRGHVRRDEAGETTDIGAFEL
jgi:hypothetical protein